MRQVRQLVFIAVVLLAMPSVALAWHDTGHMVVAQIAYLRLSPAAKRQVDRLLVTPQGKRPLIHLCAGYYTPACEKTYDPITIAVWMDDFKGDSLNDEYETWHYINYKPLFDGVPERTNVGPEPLNVLDRINWCINTLRKGTGRDKTDAEVLGFLFHLVGDVHQPLHATTRYSAKNPDGDAGGNGFRVTMPPETGIRNLHSYWDSVGADPAFASPKRPLDEASRARIRALAEQIMAANPADSNPASKDLNVQQWVEESNRLAREFAYVGIKENETPPKAYAAEARKIMGRRIALAGYRLAGVLNSLFIEPETK